MAIWKSLINKKYFVLCWQGFGFWNCVYLATEKFCNTQYALKKIDAFSSLDNAKLAYREAATLELLKTHPNVLAFKGVFFGSNFRDIYICTEKLGMKNLIFTASNCID